LRLAEAIMRLPRSPAELERLHMGDVVIVTFGPDRRSARLLPPTITPRNVTPAESYSYGECGKALAAGVVADAPLLLRRSDHRSVQALEKDIRSWVAAWNENPKPFIWTKTAEQILESLSRLLQQINCGGH
jgi:hypothetical protein